MVKLRIIALGGTGANIAYEIKDYFDALDITGNGIADIEYLVLDTSEANKHKATAIDAEFFKIDDTRIGSKGVVGSGTIRGENLDVIKNGVVKFLNNTGIFEENETNFALLVHSASGATGSVAAPIIVKEFLERDVNFGTITIGDSSTLHVTSNTIDTLQTFHNLAKKNRKNISMMFRDNAMSDTLTSVNLDVVSFVVATSIFVSGENEQLDPADMAVFFKPHMLAKKFNVPSGISIVDVTSGDNFGDDQYVVTRVLTDNNNTTIDVPSMSNRQGVILDKSVLDNLGDKGSLPLTMHSRIGLMGTIMTNLKQIKDAQQYTFEDDDMEVTDEEFVL